MSSRVKTNIWLWCKTSSASNTLKPAVGIHRRNKGEDASHSSSYPLTLRASLFPGNHVEVPNVFFFPSSCCGFIVIVILGLQRWQKACVTCCGAGKGKSFLCTEYTGGRQSEPSKCDSMGPSRHRRTKKGKIHMDAHANAWTQVARQQQQQKKRIKNIQYTQGFTSKHFFPTHSYAHTAWHSVCLSSNAHRNN